VTRSEHFFSFPRVQQRVSEILDAMGNASAKAQGLKGAITTADKLRAHSEHVVYLLLDRGSNGGRGSVVGLLKMGRKNLFLLDRQGDQNEVGGKDPRIA
jgi:alpha-tubulin N-acetyltransferase 1